MRIPLSWLEELAPLGDPTELAERLTAAGLECAVEPAPRIPAGVVTGRIVACERHPNADKLSVCTVDVGDGTPRTIVCGAPNATSGPVAAAALPGANLGDFVIAERKLRGVMSQGMLCSETELGLSEDHSGIILLPEDTPVGMPLAEALGLEATLVTEPTSNRGDLMSVLGVAREVAAVRGRRFTPPAPDVPADPGAGPWNIEIEDGTDCPRYGGRVIEGLRWAPSPPWMARRLQAAGIRSISNLVDVTNYVLLEHGHPLHAFDLDRLHGTRIGVRRARPGEKLTTLDDKERETTPDVLLITDESGPVAAGGVMGGASTRVSESTTRLFLEGASFAGPRVRAGSRALHLTTDASLRFERGVDAAGVPAALDRAVELLLATNPGARLVHSVDLHPIPRRPAPVALRRSTLRRILGVDPDPAEVRDILDRLGFERTADSEDRFEVVPPSFRRDVTAEEDLVEEVGRIWGYDRIPDRTCAVAGVSRLVEPRVVAESRARHLAISLGLVEVVTPGLVDSRRELEIGGGGTFFGPAISLRNPMSQDRDALRGSLLPSLLSVLETNVHRGSRDLALFEVGRVYRHTGQAVEETLRASILLAGHGAPGADALGGKSFDFFDMKGFVEVYVEEFWGLPATFAERAEGPFESVAAEGGPVLEVRVPGDPDRVIGHFGAIGSALRKRCDLPEDLPVFVAELDLAAGAPRDEVREFRELPRYPAANRDLALVVAKTVRQSDVGATIVAAGGELLEECRLFDVWEGAPLADTERSLAFTIAFRAPDRSLVSEEVERHMQEIVARVGREHDARIR
ncbi:MAG: phenylalanine--tRNA ligase subunit beta [bacterium]